jgi:hypothetical protein
MKDKKGNAASLISEDAKAGKSVSNKKTDRAKK